MGFATDYLEQIAQLGSHLPLPRVRALHLPPLADGNRKWGEFCALELADGSLGLSYVMLDDTLERLTAARDALGIEGADALTVARGYAGHDPLRKTLGFAAANAITRHFFDRAGFSPQDSTDSIGGLAPGAGDHVGMIGYFAPLAGRIVASGARLTVVELRADLAGPQPGFEITLDAARLQDCNKVLSTSTILLNDTLDAVLGHCAGSRHLVMIGPSAGCLPDALFARGVTGFGGTWIEDRDGFVATLPSGESWSRFARKTMLNSSNYPGAAALLARLG
ncbi:MAG: hypothetical protein KDH15_09080 [Rhodocyclaceae bacterium]|nr:hypothetical protein [Rhodocyclaceae bacterium]